MFVSCRTRPFLLALTAGSVPFLFALSLQGQPVSAIPKAMISREVADSLDKIIQPRFQDITAGQFGLTRLVPVARGHQALGFAGYFKTHTPLEAALLAHADSARRPYIIGFLHCVHVPGQPDRGQAVSHPMTASASLRNGLDTLVVKGTLEGFPIGYFERTEPLIRKAALSALPAAVKGRDAQTVTGDWTLFLRPVVASHDSCLRCHEGTKRGDTLGVMVYAVDKPVIAASVKSLNPGSL